MIEIVISKLLGAWKMMLTVAAAALIATLFFLPGSSQQVLERGWTTIEIGSRAVSAEHNRFQLLERGAWLGSKAPKPEAPEVIEVVVPDNDVPTYALVGTIKNGERFSAFLIDEESGFHSAQRGDELDQSNRVDEIGRGEVQLRDKSTNELVELKLYGIQGESENEE